MMSPSYLFYFKSIVQLFSFCIYPFSPCNVTIYLFSSLICKLHTAAVQYLYTGICQNFVLNYFRLYHQKRVKLLTYTGVSTNYASKDLNQDSKSNCRIMPCLLHQIKYTEHIHDHQDVKKGKSTLFPYFLIGKTKNKLIKSLFSS